MGGDGGDAEGRAKCAWTFCDHSFFNCSLTEGEYHSGVANYISSGFSARHPSKTEAINNLHPDELAIPVAHFEVGLRLPFWPEINQLLYYYGVIPGQITPNSIVVMVGFACYLREERIEFNLLVFRKLFSFRANKDGAAFFASQHTKVCETVNKSHYWPQKFVFVKGPFGNVPFSPLQRDEPTYHPPVLGGHEVALFKFMSTNFEVAYL